MNPSTKPGVALPRALKIVGRPPFQASDDDRAKVSRMTGLALPQSQVAIILGITPKTLRKHFPQELKAGRNRSVRNRIRRSSSPC
jgi:hypothetical protein